MKKTLILLGFLALAPFAKGQLLLEALEGEIPFTPSEKCLERVKDKHYGDGVHNYIYCAVQGPNGKKWLNLNLGAEYAKESSPHFNPEAQPIDNEDWKAFGNLYQWGRDSDGHEQVEYRQGSENWEFRPINGVRSTRLAEGEQSNQMVADPSSNVYAHNLGNTWTKDPCPNGYHIATINDILSLGRLNFLIGEHYATTLFGSTLFSNLKLMSSPSNDHFVSLIDGWNPSLARLGSIGAGTGTSDMWMGGEMSSSMNYNGLNWTQDRYGSTGNMIILDRGKYVANNGTYTIVDFSIAGFGEIVNALPESEWSFRQTAKSIRCVQN